MDTERYELPQSLRDKLQAFEVRLKRLETVITVCGTGVGFIFSWLFLYISDRVWDTPLPVRLAIAMAAMAVVAGFINFWLKRWLYRKRNLRDLAKLIQKEHRELGDRLLGIVELAEGNHPEGMSPALVRAAIRQVAGESDDLDFRQAAHKESPKRFSLVFIACLALFGGLLYFNPQAGINTILRLLNPVTPPDRYTFVSLKNLPEQLVVYHGEGFTINVGVDDDSFAKPDRAKATIGELREPIAVDINDGWARFLIPPQTTESNLRIRVFDATRTVRILPKLRPAIKEITAFVSYPDYLKKSSPPRGVEGITFSALKGSRVTLAADLGRKMTSVVFTVNGQDRSAAVTLTPRGFTVKDLLVNAPVDLEMSWVDCFGLEALKSHKLRLLPQDDMGPSVELPELRTGLYRILFDESMELSIQADDDHGLKDLAVEWFATDRDGNRLNVQLAKQVIVKGDPEKTYLKGTFILSADLMGIPPGNVIHIYGLTNDYFPKREPTQSPVYQFYIQSYAEHAKHIQEEFEKLQTRLEGVIRDQAGLKRTADELKAQDPADLQKPETTAKIKQLESEQAANRKLMEKLARKGINLLQEAMRNKKLSPQLLREWTRMLQTMKDIAGSNMKEAGRQLGKAGQGKKGTQRKKDMEKAAEEMAKAIEKMKKLLKDFNKAMENLAAQNFVQRLKGLAQSEVGIRTRTQAIIGQTVGVRAADLSPELRNMLGKIADSSRDTQKNSAVLIKDLDAFFTRTRTAKYEAVVKEMRGAKLLDNLYKHTKAIEENRGMTVIQLAIQWENAFNKWATMLGSGDTAKSQGKGEGQQLTAEQMELLIRMLRVVQQEYNLLTKTRRLDGVKDFDESYEAESKKLALTQKELRKEVDDLLTKVPGSVKSILEKAGTAMDDAAALLDTPETGPRTQAAELEVIELLTNSCKSCSQSMGGQPGLLGMLMQQMMQGMGMGQGNQGGGSMAGGGNDDGNTKQGDAASKDGLDDRAESKTAGRSLDRVPPEFREALKAYYNRLQEINDQL